MSATQARTYQPKERQRRLATCAATMTNLYNSEAEALTPEERETLREAAKIVNREHLKGVRMYRVLTGQ